MRAASQLLFSVVVLGLVLGLAGCTPKPKATTAEAGQPRPEVRERPAAPIPEEVVEQPTTESLVSEEVQEELPEDIQELNQRGYLDHVYFDTNEYELRPDAREALAKNSAWLQEHASIKLLLEGHCDERNTREYNLALGERRATAVRDYLVFLGVASDRMTTRSYGEERPFALGHDESAWQQNRRTHFVITAR